MKSIRVGSAVGRAGEKVSGFIGVPRGVDPETKIPVTVITGFQTVAAVPQSLTVGGRKNNRLFITATTSLYAIHTAVRGAVGPANNRLPATGL